VLVILWRV